jgi:flagellar protein FlbD
MILVKKLSGTEIVLNSDLIETIEATPDTVITLIDGTRYLVVESPEDILDRILAYRSALLRLAERPAPERASAARLDGEVVDFASERADRLHHAAKESPSWTP